MQSDKRTRLIYCATCKVNGKKYVGKWSDKFNHLLTRHKKAEESGVFHRAIRLHGWDNFEWEILFQGEITVDALNQLEMNFIEDLNTRLPYGYNMTSGGDGGCLPGVICHSKETKERMSRAAKGKKKSESHRKALSEVSLKQWKDESYREATIKSMREASKRPETIKRRSAASKEAQNRPEVREKKSKAITDKGSTLEEMYGVEVAKEIKSKLSGIQKKGWADENSRNRRVAALRKAAAQLWADPVRRASILASRAKAIALKKSKSVQSAGVIS